MIKRLNKIVLFLLLVLMTFSTLLFMPASAFDNLSFGDLSKYDDITLLRFNEFGFSSAKNEYALELYLYNPKKRDIDFHDSRNQVQMAYTSNENDVLRVQYNKYRLVYVDSVQNDLYLRVKIAGFDMPRDDERFYCISGIELVSSGDSNANEYGVSSIYKCETIDGDTTISKTTLPTCEVDVHHTFYRTDFSEKNKNQWSGWGNQLSSCYFSLPENFSGEKKEYGNLEALTAEFYNYFTKPVLVLGNETDYNSFKSQVGNNSNKDLSFYTESDLMSIPNDSIPSMPYNTYLYYNTYNMTFDNYLNNTYLEYSEIDVLNWVLSDFRGLDFSSEDYFYDGNNLLNYFNNYAGQVGRQTAINDLFVSKEYYDSEKISLCDNAFDYGYNKHTYSIAEKPESEDDVFGFDLKFDNTGSLGKFFGIFSSETERVLPLQKVEKIYLSLTNEQISEKYLIHKGDVEVFKKYALNEIANNRDVWLFRYDACEYYANDVHGLENGSGLLARESVYLDFDILSFRFNQNGEKYTIANIMSPEDVFNGLSGDNNPDDKSLFDTLITILQYVLYVLSAGGVVVLAFNIIKSILKSDLHIVLKIVLTIICIVIATALFGIVFSYVNKLITYLRSLI